MPSVSSPSSGKVQKSGRRQSNIQATPENIAKALEAMPENLKLEDGTSNHLGNLLTSRNKMISTTPAVTKLLQCPRVPPKLRMDPAAAPRKRNLHQSHQQHHRATVPAAVGKKRFLTLSLIASPMVIDRNPTSLHHGMTCLT
jgi:hypothetical protein